MEYQKPFRNAFKIAGKFKSLWLAGLFTAGIHLGNHLFQLYDNLGKTGFQDLKYLPPDISGVYWLFALITLIILLFGSIFQAGLIKVIYNLKPGSGLYIRQIWRYGADNWGNTLAFIFIKLLAVFAIFQLRIMLTEDKSVFGSFRSGLIFLFNNYKESFVSGLIFLLLLIAALIISLFISGIVLAFIFLLSFMLSSISIKTGFAAFTILFMSLFLPVSLVIFGFFGLLRDAFWTLTYIKLNEQKVFIFNNR
jgi:hypothetical protein